MPNCFQLTRKSALHEGPVKFILIDEEMCKHFNLPCDPVQWHNGWYDYIGLCLALGDDWDKIRQGIREWEKDGSISPYAAHMIEICDWLEANFTPNAWVEIGRR